MTAAMKHWFDHILFHMCTQPAKPAMVTEETVVTYGMLQGAIDGCAHRIEGLDLKGNAPVAITVESPIRQMTLALALFRCGIPSITLEPGQTGAGLMPFAAEFGDPTRNLLGDQAPFVAVSGDWFAPQPGGVSAGRFSSSGEVCRVCLTSGSTGEPKVFALTVADIGRLAEGFAAFNWNSLLCLPGLSSSFGFTSACTTLATGRTACFSTSPFQSIRMIELFSIDFVMAATEQLLALTRVARSAGANLKSLRTVEVGGAVPSRALLESATMHVCKEIYCRYGATETGLIARAPARDVVAQEGYVGRVQPGVEIIIEDSGGKSCPLNTIGRIKSRRADEPKDRWTDLGDLGWLSANGQLFVIGRATDAEALKGAQRMSPVHEAEHLLRLEWDTDDAAAALVEGGPDSPSPQIWIGIVGGADASADRLETILRTRGIPYRVRLIVLPSIPRAANGKVRRDQLKMQLLAAGGPGQTRS
jgi:acyl-CoA synthetase (AMP-forming)/AMP-acid ligase II